MDILKLATKKKAKDPQNIKFMPIGYVHGISKSFYINTEKITRISIHWEPVPSHSTPPTEEFRETHADIWFAEDNFRTKDIELVRNLIATNPTFVFVCKEGRNGTEEETYCNIDTISGFSLFRTSGTARLYFADGYEKDIAADDFFERLGVIPQS